MKSVHVQKSYEKSVRGARTEEQCNFMNERSLVPRPSERGRGRPGTHCSRMRGIFARARAETSSADMGVHIERRS